MAVNDVSIIIALNYEANYKQVYVKEMDIIITQNNKESLI
jgi:hypothetical protein